MKREFGQISNFVYIQNLDDFGEHIVRLETTQFTLLWISIYAYHQMGDEMAQLGIMQNFWN